MIELHQHFTHPALHSYRILPAATMRRWRLAIFTQNAELRAMNMERMQHHVALAGDQPALVLPPGRGEHRHIHIKGFTVDTVGVMEIEALIR